MTGERASIFDAAEDFDVTAFAPKAEPAAKPKLDKTIIRAAAEKKGFVSREAAPKPVSQPVRAQRRHVTGRNRQINLKVTDDVLRRFYALADAQGWVLGEALEHAVGALEVQLKGRGEGSGPPHG